MFTLYTPATGFPDLEAKIAYGLARVGIETFGIEKVIIRDNGGFYTVAIDSREDELVKLERTFNMLCSRLLASSFIPFSTPGIGGRSAESIRVVDNELFSLDNHLYMNSISENVKSENFCRHSDRKKVSNVIGFTAFASTGVLCKREGVDYIDYQGSIRRPTDPRKICKTCGLLALLGTWYATFVFSVAGREVLAIPIPKSKIDGSKLQEIFSLQHQIRKNWFGQEIPQVLVPLIFLSKIPSSADILEGFDLFVAVLSRQQGYHVDGLLLIPISNYLDFLRQTPYNIATVDKMLNTFGNKRYPKEACDALMELNNTIYYRKLDSLPKFARLYALETTPKDSNKWTSLLYKETSKYLLREVAMIKCEIIESPAVGSLARTLRYFIRERKYSYADNIRNARKDSRGFEDNIVKMLREGELRRVQQEQDKKQGKKIENWIHLPKDEEVKEVCRLANADFDNTRIALLMLAFSFPTKVTEEENVETTEEVQNA